ncbi:MAG: protein-disulfide reductase DsbD domain-containing protein [Bryobacteraceae bacterium]
MNISMKSRHFLTKSSRLIAALSSLAVFSWAQPQRVTVEPPSQITVKRGEEVSHQLSISIQPGFHVNSNKPKDEFLIPLQLTWSPGPLIVESVSYPQPEEIKVGPDTLSVFTGKVVLQTKFRASNQASSLPTAIVGKLHYQACNNQMCFRPSTVEVRLPVVVQ